MNKDYLHHNGNIINGNWESIDNPEFISPRINGKNLFDYVISTLKQHINKLPSSDDSDKMYIQIIANNGSSNYLFEDGPQELTNNNKITALSYLDNLKSDVISPIDPWNDICRILESEYIGQLVILSAWKPALYTASNNQTCIGLNKGNFANIINEYNQFTRSKSGTGTLVIDAISLYNNFCEGSKNIFVNNWLGSISKGAESNCINIR